MQLNTKYNLKPKFSSSLDLHEFIIIEKPTKQIKIVTFLIKLLVFKHAMQFFQTVNSIDSKHNSLSF